MTMRATIEVPSHIQTEHKIYKNHVNMVMEHSLGFGNESFGNLYDAQGAQSATPPTIGAVGRHAPAIMFGTRAARRRPPSEYRSIRRIRGWSGEIGRM